MTTGILNPSKTSAICDLSLISLYFAVGILFRSIKSFAKDFEPSSIAHFLSAPMAEIPTFFNSSTIPLIKGSSGPTTTKSIPISLDIRANSIKFSASMTSPSSANPSLGLHKYNFSNNGDCFIFHASVCSLAPPPYTRTFKFILPR